MKFPRIKRFLEEGRTETEKELVLLSVKAERIREAYTQRIESEEKLFSDMLTTACSEPAPKEREEVESSEKD